MQLRKVSAALVLIAACAAPGTWAGLDPASDNPPPPGPPPTPPPEVLPPRGPESASEQLLGPIALYPDPLLALVLAASTSPVNITAAAAYLIRYGDPTQIDNQRWDPSVRALAHYPSVLSWMAQNIEWTQAVGSAYLSSPSDVMASIQRLRTRALAAGALASTAQQQVVVEDNVIQILPAQPESIYAPVYDPEVVYSQQPYYDYNGPFINFGPALPVGLWLSYCFDWADPAIWVGAWGSWHGDSGWRAPHPGKGHAPPGNRPWQPPKHTPSPPPGHHVDAMPQPRLMIGAPKPPPAYFKRGPGQTAAPGTPRAAVVPLDRPRLPNGISAPAPSSTRPEPERRSGPPEGSPRYQGSAPVPASSPPAPKGEAPAPRAPPPHESGPPPQSHSAPPPVRESAPVQSHVSAPAPAPAPPPSTPSGETKNR